MRSSWADSGLCCAMVEVVEMVVVWFVVTWTRLSPEAALDSGGGDDYAIHVGLERRLVVVECGRCKGRKLGL